SYFRCAGSGLAGAEPCRAKRTVDWRVDTQPASFHVSFTGEHNHSPPRHNPSSAFPTTPTAGVSAALESSVSETGGLLRANPATGVSTSFLGHSDKGVTPVSRRKPNHGFRKLPMVAMALAKTVAAANVSRTKTRAVAGDTPDDDSDTSGVAGYQPSNYTDSKQNPYTYISNQNRKIAPSKIISKLPNSSASLAFSGVPPPGQNCSSDDGQQQLYTTSSQQSQHQTKPEQQQSSQCIQTENQLEPHHRSSSCSPAAPSESESPGFEAKPFPAAPQCFEEAATPVELPPPAPTAAYIPVKAEIFIPPIPKPASPQQPAASASAVLSSPQSSPIQATSKQPHPHHHSPLHSALPHSPTAALPCPDLTTSAVCSCTSQCLESGLHQYKPTYQAQYPSLQQLQQQHPFKPPYHAQQQQQ
ncbi:unnamed protein product, partial [Closterium sp. NIES-64]